MKLYDRDYCIEPKEDELQEYNKILKEEYDGEILGKKNLYYKYPEAVRHHKSLFPNNHIELYDWKKNGNMKELTEAFSKLVHSSTVVERDILKYINKTPAYYIIGSLLCHKNFGHHETYIFPEFSIGNGKFYADYLIIGKNSGGYEFLFVELEAPNKSTTIKSGYEGVNTRKGLIQLSDWESEIESNYSTLTTEFEKNCNRKQSLPEEFYKYDSTRMHFAVISGLRDDYNETTYRERRKKIQRLGIDMLHYDNLIQLSEELESKNTF